MAKADDMAERQKGCAIVAGKSLKKGITGAPQMVESLSRDAFADVKTENDVERKLFEADEINFLQHSIVSDLEILRPKPADNLATIRDEHVHANRVNARRERGLLRGNSGGAQNNGDPKKGLHIVSDWTI
jgi:hypothetical protein